MFLGSSGNENSWQRKGLTKENLLPVGLYCCLTSLGSQAGDGDFLRYGDGT